MSKDWSKAISVKEFESILIGLQDIEVGNISSHEEAMKRIEERFGI